MASRKAYIGSGTVRANGGGWYSFTYPDHQYHGPIVFNAVPRSGGDQLLSVDAQGISTPEGGQDINYRVLMNNLRNNPVDFDWWVLWEDS